jgi:hypothetical protein
MIGYCSSFVVIIPLVEDAPECESRGINFKFVWFCWVRVPEDRLLPSPRPWDFPPSIDGDISRADDPMELDDPE